MGKAFGGFYCSRREQKQVGSLAHSLRVSCSLNGVRAGVDAGVRPEGWRRWSDHTLGGAVWVFALFVSCS